jgi:hypothetical protein
MIASGSLTPCRAAAHRLSPAIAAADTPTSTYGIIMTTNTKLDVLTPTNCQLIIIDHQPQMAFGVQSIDRQVLKNNVVALAKSAKVFNIPTIITTVETQLLRLHLSGTAVGLPRSRHPGTHLDELLG